MIVSITRILGVTGAEQALSVGGNRCLSYWKSPDNMFSWTRLPCTQGNDNWMEIHSGAVAAHTICLAETRAFLVRAEMLEKPLATWVCRRGHCPGAGAAGKRVPDVTVRSVPGARLARSHSGQRVPAAPGEALGFPSHRLRRPSSLVCFSVISGFWAGSQTQQGEKGHPGRCSQGPTPASLLLRVWGAPVWGRQEARCGRRRG